MALKTDYKDYLPPETGRKFRITDAGGGLSAIEDATAYLQQGDTFGAEDINATNRQVNALCAGYSAAETAMPFTWVDGKTIYRRVYTLAKSDFTADTATYYLANGKNTTAEYTSTTLTKTGLLAGAAQVLPMTQAAWMDGNFRPMPYNRLTAYNFNMGWRLDKSGSSWTFAVETGGNNLSGDGQIALIAYYTK